MKKQILSLVLGTVALAGCNEVITVVETPAPTVDDRFDINNYTAIANQADNLEGLWVMVINPPPVVMTVSPFMVDPGTDPGNKDTYIQTTLSQTVSGKTRSLCTITLNDDPATLEIEEYQSTCRIGNDTLHYSTLDNSVVSSDAMANLTETGRKAMSGLITEPMSGGIQSVSLKRVGDFGADIGDLTLTVNGVTEQVLNIHTFSEMEGSLFVEVPGISYSQNYPIAVVQAFGDTGQIETYISLGVGEEVTDFVEIDGVIEWVRSVYELSFGEQVLVNTDTLAVTDTHIGYEAEIINGQALTNINQTEDYSLNYSIDTATVHNVTATFSGVDESSGDAFSGSLVISL